MAPAFSVTGINIDSVKFPATAKPPGSTNTLFLGGAGVRGLNIEGNFVKFTAIGVYLENSAVPWLAAKWKGKTLEELLESDAFSRDIVTGPFEKFTRVTMILPLTGVQYSEKLSENCVNIWKSLGIYTDSEAKAIEKFLEVFKPHTFPPGSSILFTLSPKGSFTVSFSKGASLPEVGNVVIENKLLSEAILESIIGKQGVSPPARKTLAERLLELFKLENSGDDDIAAATNGKVEVNQAAATDGKVEVSQAAATDGKVEVSQAAATDGKVVVSQAAATDGKVEVNQKVSGDEKVLEGKVNKEVEELGNKKL